MSAGLVLVACQVAETRDAYAKALTAAGLRAITAADSVGALVKAAALRPRAIVLDLDMPGVSVDCARRLQGFPTHDIPVLLVGDDIADGHPDAVQFVLLRKGSSPAVVVAAVLAQLKR